MRRRTATDIMASRPGRALAVKRSRGGRRVGGHMPAVRKRGHVLLPRIELPRRNSPTKVLVVKQLQVPLSRILALTRLLARAAPLCFRLVACTLFISGRHFAGFALLLFNIFLFRYLFFALLPIACQLFCLAIW